MAELPPQPSSVSVGDQPDHQPDQPEQHQIAHQNIHPMQPDEVAVKVNADAPKVKAPKPVKEWEKRGDERPRQNAQLPPSRMPLPFRPKQPTNDASDDANNHQPPQPHLKSLYRHQFPHQLSLHPPSPT
jgi:hypothetical protein